MEHKLEETTCSNCGFTVTGRFVGDICPKCGLPYWKCSQCQYTLTAKVPPDVCPECGAKCSFIDATCYTAECGSTGRLDPRI